MRSCCVPVAENDRGVCGETKHHRTLPKSVFMSPIKSLRTPELSTYSKYKGVIASLLMHLLVIAAIWTTPSIGNMTTPQVLFVTMHNEAAWDERTATFASDPVRIKSKFIHEARLRPVAQPSSNRHEAQSSAVALVPPGETLIDAQPSQQEHTDASPASVQSVSAGGRSESSALTVIRAGADTDSPKGERISNIGDTRFGERGAPYFVHQEIPSYPALAHRFGKEGRVLLKLLIDADGKLRHVEVIEAAGYGFTEASVDAVKRSTYAPGFLNGSKVAMRVLLPVRFRLQ
ncbi:MAG: hypothetical protein C0394_01915 [Syntrophus sp. (in: bacteria)]|nr:hypothetical protein [Syntrophus sp. (in: bacteria)]